MHGTQLVCAVALWAVAVASPAADTYTLDKVHTQIFFSVSHLGFSNPVGRFLRFDGGFKFNRKDMSRSNVQVTIYADSVEMGDEKWNKALRGKDYFNVKEHPTIAFESTKVEPVGESSATIYGNLTLLGVTRPVAVNMRFNKAGAHPLTGDYVAGFSGLATIKRSDFGMTSALRLIGDQVDIRLEVEGILNIR